MKEEGKSVFKVIDSLGLQQQRVRDVLLASAGAGDEMRIALEMGRFAWEENIALTKEAELRYSTMAKKLSVVRNRMFDVQITMGEA